MINYRAMDIILILILIFYLSAVTSFFITCAAFSLSAKIRMNLWILAMILGIVALSSI